MEKGLAPGSDEESPETRILLGSSGPRLQANLITQRKPILGALGPQRPSAALVGLSSQADLRMVTAALLHAHSTRPSKRAPGKPPKLEIIKE